MLLKRKQPKLLLPQTKEIVSLERRFFMKQTLTLGALGLLTGCNVADDSSAQKVLDVMSQWNDKAQAALFNPNRLALTYSEAEITDPFPFNAYYGEDDADRKSVV